MALTDSEEKLLKGLIELRHLQGRLAEKQKEKNVAREAAHTAYQSALQAIDADYNGVIASLKGQAQQQKDTLEQEAVSLGKTGFWAWLGF